MRTFAAKALAVALLASVFGCEDNSARVAPPDASDGNAPDSSVSTFPDSSMPETGEAEAAADGGTCNGHAPGYIPPPFHPAPIPACTPASIAAYVQACHGVDSSAACLAWQADPANAACESCVLRTDGTGPLLFYPDGTFAQINEAGCIAAGGAPDCGAAVSAEWHCLVAACGDCPLDGGQVTGACYEMVACGDCASYGQAQDMCESTLTGPVTACELTMGHFPDQLTAAATRLCGIPSDAGVASDAGGDGASEAGSSDAAPDEAGANEAGTPEAGAADAGAE
jgi:hypothetical protein